MKRSFILLSISTLLFSMSFTNSKVSYVDNGHILLVLTNPIGCESFSIFNISEIDGILIGYNVGDYNVSDGIYRIESCSDDKFYHRRIVISEE